MRFLFDQNLAQRLVRVLADVYPGSVHVRALGLHTADDAVIWEYAVENRLVIVSKDADFHQRSFLDGPPPKVVWVRLGNCSTDDVARILRSRRTEILAFESDATAGFLVVS